MAWSYTESGNNTASTSWGITFPAASTGDLIIVNLAWDDSTNVTSVSAPSGPNGETFTNIQGPQASNGTANRGQCWYTVATGSWSAGNRTFTPNASEQWTATVIKVPAGEFDATTPIGASNYLASTTTGNPSLPSLTAGSTDGGGTVVGFISSDVDDADGTVSGWTTQVSTDRGAVAIDIVTRDTTATDSESISSASGWTYPSARSWVSFIYIVRALVNDPPTVVLDSPGTSEFFVSSSASGGSGSSITVDKPTGTTDGDVLVAIIHTNGTSCNPADNNGSTPFTGILENREYNGSSAQVDIFYRVCGSSEPSTYSFSLSASDRYQIHLVCLRNINVSDLWDSVPTDISENTGTGTTPTTDSITITSPSIVIAFATNDSNSLTFTGTPTDWTTIQNTSGNQLLASAYKVVSPQTLGAISWELSTSNGTWLTNVFSLNLSLPTVSDTTPDLTFTGTDGDSDDISYEVQVDTVNTFDSQGGGANMEQGIADNAGGYVQTPTIQFSGNTTTGNTILVSVTYNDDVTGNVSSITDTTSNSYAKIAGGSSGGDTYTELWYAYNITGGTTPTITVNMSNANYHDFTITAREISGLTTTDPLDVKAEGSVSAGTSHTSATTATTSQANELVYSVIGLAGNTTYTAGSGFGDLSQTNGSDLYQSSASQMKVVSSAGTQTANITSANSLVGYFIVATFKIDAGPLIDKLSDTDSGFSGTPDNTDPFSSGQAVTYTVQAGDELISNNTYYWRVRGKDPSGSDTYGDWSDIYSFTINTPPTVALNSPTDTQEISDTTPDLVFTGTDADDDNITYEIEVDTNNTFDSVSDSDSYSISNQDTEQTLNTTTWIFGQSFNGVSGKLVSSKFYIRKNGSPTGNIVAELYAHSGTFGSSSIGTGTALAVSSPKDVSTLSTSLTLETFVFEGNYVLDSGTNYVIAIHYENGGSITNNVKVGTDQTTLAHSGNGTSRSNTGTWTALFFGSEDVIFEVNTSSSIINNKSETDLGFSGSPDNTDPFTSGQAVTYTVQSALDPDVYYWRLRGKDPSGSNIWGAWSSTRSFTITSGSTTQTQTVSSKIRILSTGIVKTVSSKLRILQTAIQKTVSAKIRILKINTQTVSSKIRILSTGTTKTVSSKLRILNTYTITISSKLRILIANINKTVQSKLRILKHQPATVSSKIRILSSGEIVTTSAKLRIYLADITRTVSGKLRIKKLTEHTISAKIMISSTGVTKSISAKLRILKTLTQTISSKVRILTSSITKTVSSRLRILKTENKTISAKIRILSTGVIYTISSKLRILNTYISTIQAKLRILLNVENTISAKIRILTTGSIKTITSKLRILKTENKTIQAKLRILKNIEIAISSKLRIIGTLDKNVSAKLYVLSTGNNKSVSAKIDIKKTVDQQITSRLRILIVGLKTIESKLRILKVVTQTISAKLRVKKLEEKTVSSKLRILSTGTIKMISSLIRIKKTINKTITSRIRIIKGVTNTISSKLWVLTIINKTISSKLRIIKNINRIVTSKIRILSTGEIKNISSKIWILIINTNTISALISIRKIYTKNISAKIKIRTSYTLNLNQLYKSDSQFVGKLKTIVTKKSILNGFIKRMYKVR